MKNYTVDSIKRKLIQLNLNIEDVAKTLNIPSSELEKFKPEPELNKEEFGQYYEELPL